MRGCAAAAPVLGDRVSKAAPAAVAVAAAVAVLAAPAAYAQGTASTPHAGAIPLAGPATVGSQSAAPIELASGRAVMAVGGFSGGDQAPTLAQFKRYVADGKVHYFIARGDGRAHGVGGPGVGRPGEGGAAGQITAWVTANFTARTVGGQTVYDLTRPASGSAT